MFNNQFLCTALKLLFFTGMQDFFIFAPVLIFYHVVQICVFIINNYINSTSTL
jgi:hypothetical protein